MTLSPLLDLPSEITNIISRHLLYKRPQFVLRKIAIGDLNDKLREYIKYINKMSTLNHNNIMLETILSGEVLKKITIGNLLKQNIYYTNAYYETLCKMFGRPIEVLYESKKLRIVNKYNKGDILFINNSRSKTDYSPHWLRMIKIDRVTVNRYYYRMYRDTSTKKKSGEHVLKYTEKGEICESIIIFENKKHVLEKSELVTIMECYHKSLNLYHDTDNITYDKIKIIDRLRLDEIQEYQRIHGTTPESFYKQIVCVDDIFNIPNLFIG